MPTYEYQCDACEHQFEEFQSMKDEALTKCPKCGKKKLRRLFGTGAALLFKGSGFYQTDYRSDSYKAAAKADQGGDKPAGKSDSGKSEGGGSTDTSSTSSSTQKTSKETPKSST